MASYGLNDVKTGLKILVDGDPYTIVDTDFIKPGKGAFVVNGKHLFWGQDRLDLVARTLAGWSPQH